MQYFISYYFIHTISIAQRIIEYGKSSIKARCKSKEWKSANLLPPTTLQFQTTNICNVNCIFCGYQYNKEPKRIMSMKLFNQVLNEYVAMGGTRVGIAPMVGEPLIDPNILDKLYIIKKNPSIKNCYMFTNGILLDKIDITQLLSSGVNEIHISTSGFDKDMYDRVYRSKNYDRAIKNIHNILKKNCELGRPVRITLEIRSDESVYSVLNKKDFKVKIAPYLNKKDISFLLYFDSWGGLIKKTDLTGKMKLAKPRQGKLPCSRTFTAMVSPDGKLRACGCRSLFKEVDELIIGDLKVSSLGDIWYGKKLENLRRSFEHGNIPKVCENCSMYHPI